MAVKEKPNTTVEEADAVKSAGFSVYLGPTISGVIQTATIYPVGKDEALKLPELQLALGKKPGIAALVVDGATLAKDRIDVRTEGTALYQAYAAVKN